FKLIKEFSMFGSLLRNVRALFRREKMEREMDAELRFHLEREIEENIRKGMSKEDAEREALKSFGGVEKTKEECREARGIMLVETLLQVFLSGSKILIKNPGFPALAALTLAWGMGANPAIFSVVYGVLFRPLPYKDGPRLVKLYQKASLAGVDD